MKRVKSARIKQKQKRNMIIIISLIISLCGIFIFNQWTRSEILKTTTVKFIENGIGTEVISELDVHVDENGEETKYYVILPDKINGYIVNKLFVNEDTVVEGEDTDELQNVISDNTNTIDENANVVDDATLDNTNVDDANTTVDDNSANQNAVNQTNTIADDIDQNTNTIIEDNVEDSLFDKVVNQNNDDLEDEITNTVNENSVTNTVDVDEKNTNTIIDEDYTNTVSNTTVVNKVVENVNTVVGNNVIDSTVVNNEVSNTVSNTVDSDNENTAIEDVENIVTDEVKFKEVYPGSIIYLTEDEVIADELTYTVEFNTKEIDGVRLYEQELAMDTTEASIVVKGFIPKDYLLNVVNEDPNEITKLMEDVEELKNTTVLAAYDITIVKDEIEYQPVEFNQFVNVAISSKEKLESNSIINKDIEMIHIDETEEEIVFERLMISNKTIDSVECTTNEFSRYAIVENNAFTDTQILVNNYDNDYNHYMGLNYTEKMVGRDDANKYTKDNLAKITVNYYGYKKDESAGAIQTNRFEWGWIDNTTQNQARTRTIRPNAIVTFDDNQYVDFTKPFRLAFMIPYGYESRFNLEATQQHTANANYRISRDGNAIIIEANNWDSWIALSFTRYYLNFAMVFNQTDDVTVNNTTNTPSSLGMYVDGTAAIPTGYISTESDERQSLMTYTHAAPINADGSVSIELIDNPFMDRPRGRGFDGWRAINTADNTITMNGTNYIQTLTTRQALTTNASGVKEATVDLYVNWAAANVIIYEENGTNGTQGTFESPVNTWDEINTRLRNNTKTATAASSRELNIIVIVSGTLEDINVSNNVAYTITSIYGGEDYRDDGEFYVDTNSVTLTKDVQLAFLTISGSNNYNSGTGGTSDINKRIIGSTYNLRIGRGMMPDSNDFGASTWAQIQGGGTARNTYKLVIESGKYCNIQVGRRSDVTHNVNAIFVAGNDIDRVKSVTAERNTFHVYGKIASHSGGNEYKAADTSKPLFDMRIKSGTIGVDGYNNLVGSSNDAAYCGIYLGGHGSADEDINDRHLTIEGGRIANVIGGLGTPSDDPPFTFIYVKGGTMMSIVGGAGRSETYGDRCIQVTDGNVEYSINGGSNGVYSGNNEGILSGSSLLYVGGNAVIGSIVPDGEDPDNYQLYGSKAGCVMGAGNGNGSQPQAGRVNSSRIIIDGNANIKNSVYGGGNYGPIYGRMPSYLNGATGGSTGLFDPNKTYMIASGKESGTYFNRNGNNLSTATFSNSQFPNNSLIWAFEEAGDGTYYIRNTLNNRYLRYVYQTTTQNVRLEGQWNTTNVVTAFNGVNLSLGTNNQKTRFLVSGSFSSGFTIKPADSYTIYSVVSSGWLGDTYGNPQVIVPDYYLTTSSTTQMVSNSTTLYIRIDEPIEEEPEVSETDPLDGVIAPVMINILGGNIARNVYGGPNQKYVTGNVMITMDDGVVKGSIYGGSNASGNVSGGVNIRIRGGTIGDLAATDGDRVFGGGKGQNTSVSGNANIYINDRKNNVFIYGNSFGGSEAGSVTGSSTITVEDKYDNSNVVTYSGIIFGGGKGLGATASTGGSTKVIVDGGDYPNLTLFGGCDINGTIGATIDVEVGKTKSTKVATVYGAGRNSLVTNATDSIYVHCYPNATIVNDVYNGGMEAGIDGNNPRAVYIDGALVSGNVYGGSFESGTLSLSNVYCYNGAIVSGDVYGAGYGSGANVTGNTNVQIHSNINYDGTGGTAAKVTEVRANVFGGGRSAAVGGNTVVNINNAKINRNVFGGGKSAAVSGDTDVDIVNSNVLEDVYGGGDEAAVNGETTVDINNSVIGDAVYGGGNKGALGSNVTDKDTAVITVSNNSNVNVVYGGGAAAAVNGSVLIDVDDSTIKTIYGAGEGEASRVTQNTEIATEDSIVDKIYGGGYSGDIAGNIVIDAVRTEIRDSVYGGGLGEPAVSSSDVRVSVVDSTVANNVFGGGDAGIVNGSAQVYITNTTVGENIYGGGNNAEVSGSTNIVFYERSVAKVVFGGGNNGAVGGDTSVNIIEEAKVLDTVYGGGNNGVVEGVTSVRVDNSSIENVLFGGGKGYTATVQGTNIIFQNESTVEYIYGGGDQGEVKGGSPSETSVLVDINAVVGKNVFAGGNGASDATTKGSVSGNTKLVISGGSIIGDGNQVQEGGTGAVDVYGDPIYNGNAFGGGRGQTATVTGNTSVIVEDSTIKYNVYGGGDNGDITGNTLVRLTNATIESNAFGAGNGIPDEDHTKHIARVHGNSHLIVEGTTTVAKNIFGSGNAAKTGQENSTTAKSIVDISGGTIGKNVYGGANSSVVNGDTVTNIGIDAIDKYHGAETGYLQDSIIINGTVFGGGESMKIGVEDFDFYSISVTGTTYINVDGNTYNTQNGPVLNFKSSIFASGNASSAKTSGTITIRNYGTLNDPKEAVSLQRAGNVMIDNSALWLSGTTDSTAKFSDTYFTLNIIDSLTMKNNSTLYLRNGANKLSEFKSMYGDDGNEQKAYVTIPTLVTGVDGLEYQAVGTNAQRGGTDYLILDGVIYEKNADGTAGTRVTDVDLVETDKDGIDYNTLNRIYMYSGINLDIAKEEDPSDSDYGPVYGMTYFGMYKNAEGTGLYKGMYDEDYIYNSRVNWLDRDYNRCYVQGQHKTNHIIEEDGFYTTFEQLQVELEAGESITEEKYNNTDNGDQRSISYLNYIDPTPENSAYYMWYCGPDSDVFYYTFNLAASKFSTLGTKSLTLDGISYPNATIRLTTVESSLIDGAQLVDKNIIPNINASPDEANLMMGLAMKTGNSGWAMNGETNYYSSNNVASRDGDSVYIIENSGKSPALDFYLYHSNNITVNQELGYFRVNAEMSWKKNLTRGTARIIIDIALSTVVYEGNYYNAAITPGRQFELFTSTTTDITTKSSFSAFFELSEYEFYEIEEVKDMYNEDAYRVIQTDYQLPVNTTITMIDRHDNLHPAYYYYVVTQEDVTNNKKEYRLSDFIEMGSVDKAFDEVGMMDDYYDTNTKYQYESFIFTVDFENAQFADTTTFEIAKDQLFTLVLRGYEYDDDGNKLGYKPIFAVMDEQLKNMNFGLYNADSVIRITDADLTKDTIYPGSNTTLELEIVYNDTDNDSEEATVAVHDTRFFDKKMGVRITLLQLNNDTGLYEVIPGSSLMGTYYTITQKNTNGDEEEFNYYPRADGTTRIKVAEKVSNLFSEIEINTENSTLNGDFKILIESFGSADGIYFGVEASDSAEVDLRVVDNIYGLNTTIPAEQAIIDKTTGHTLEKDTGYISDTDKDVDVTLEYQSGLNRPYVTVQLLRRNYQTVNSTMYEKVDLADYVNEELTQVNGEYEYKALSTEDIFAVVSDEMQIENFVFNFTTKEDLISGTYRLVYTLYDLEDVEVEEKDENGTVTGTYTETRYQYIGDTYSYLVIK